MKRKRYLMAHRSKQDEQKARPPGDEACNPPRQYQGNILNSMSPVSCVIWRYQREVHHGAAWNSSRDWCSHDWFLPPLLPFAPLWLIHWLIDWFFPSLIKICLQGISGKRPIKQPQGGVKMYKENGQGMLKHVSKSVSLKHVFYIRITWSLYRCSFWPCSQIPGWRSRICTHHTPRKSSVHASGNLLKQCHPLSFLPLLTEFQNAQSHTVFLGIIWRLPLTLFCPDLRSCCSTPSIFNTKHF